MENHNGTLTGCEMFENVPPLIDKQQHVRATKTFNTKGICLGTLNTVVAISEEPRARQEELF